MEESWQRFVFVRGPSQPRKQHSHCKISEVGVVDFQRKTKGGMADCEIGRSDSSTVYVIVVSVLHTYMFLHWNSGDQMTCVDNVFHAAVCESFTL